MNILVVGVGYWGPNIVRNLAAHDEVTSIGVSDLDSDKAQKIASLYPKAHLAKPLPAAFDDGYEAMCIVTPVETHYRLAEMGLEKGLHVFVEKPITKTSDEARRLIALAEKTDRRLMVGHVFHYKPAVHKLAELVESGELGSILYMDSVRINLGLFRSDVNVLWDLAPHDLSIFEAVLKRMPLRVSAIGSKHLSHPGSPQETFAHMTLDYGEGCLGHVHVSWLSPVKQRTMIFAGDKKMAVYDDISLEDPIRIYDKGAYDPEKETAMTPVIRSGDMYVPSFRQTEPLHNQMSDFIHAIKNGKAAQTDGHAGLRVVRILETAMESLRSDGAFISLR